MASEASGSSQALSSTQAASHNAPLAPTLTAFTLARLVINGARRFPYVILTPMAMSLGVPRSTLETALSLLWATGAVSPFIGTFIDRIGRKRMMLVGVGLLALFTGLAAIGQNANVVLFAIVGGGIAKICYDPAMQAYIGDRTPYGRRGMALGITELSWSGALFIFGPLAAFLIVQVSLGAIYGVIAVGSVLAFLLIMRVVPSDVPPPILVDSDSAEKQTDKQIDKPSPFAGLHQLLTYPPAIALWLTACLFSIGAQSIIIVYEAWLRDSFALTTITLGALAWAFSVAEVSGEGVVILIADRFGKRRLSILAMLITGLLYLIVPLAGSALAAIVLLFLMFLCFETSVVVLLPMATEALPQARGTMMSINTAFFAAGNAIGVLVGGYLYRAGAGGLAANGVVAMMTALLSAGLIWRFVSE